MKYQLIIYTSIFDATVFNSDNISIQKSYDSAVKNGKFATLNERQEDGSYKTIKQNKPL